MCVCRGFKIQFISAIGFNRKSIADGSGKISNYYSTETAKAINFFILICLKKRLFNWHIKQKEKLFPNSNYRKFSLRNIYENYDALGWEIITSTTADCGREEGKTFHIKSTK